MQQTSQAVGQAVATMAGRSTRMILVTRWVLAAHRTVVGKIAGRTLRRSLLSLQMARQMWTCTWPSTRASVMKVGAGTIWSLRKCPAAERLGAVTLVLNKIG